MNWGRAHFAHYPWRCETDPWFALVAEILLQRTRASIVSRVYSTFKERFPTPDSLAEAGDPEIRQVLGGLGLGWRLPLLRRLAREVVRLGHIPEDERELRKLPGVGAYVAAAYLSLHRGKRAVLIDANIVRWLCRMTGQRVGSETRRKRWVREALEAVTPEVATKEYNYALLDFTMRMCKGEPMCSCCPLLSLCSHGKRQTNGV